MAAPVTPVMTKHRYVDILIVTALLEEQFLLDLVYPDALRTAFQQNAKFEEEKINVSGFYGKQVRLIFRNNKELSIAWTTLGDGKKSEGNSMGNIFAYDACVRLAEHFCPRFVLLLGIAGGSHPYFKRGDVGFGTKTGYSSYCKIEAEASISKQITKSKLDPSRKKQLRLDLKQLGINTNASVLKYVPRNIPLVHSSQEFCATARSIRDDDAWKDFAKSWFNEKKDAFLKGHFDLKCDNVQLGFANDNPSAKEGLVASGDAIIANTTLQTIIQEQIVFRDDSTKGKIHANMFEMESFGVGYFCQSHKIEFGMIKGICDLAGEKKDDKYRLCALSSASAFVFKIITNEKFYSRFVDSKQERIWSGKTACIWPQDGVAYKRCVGSWSPSAKNLLTTHRPCTDAALVNVQGSTELPGARLFQQAESRAYSNCVSDFIERSIRDNQEPNRLLFLFPYSVYDLLNFHRNTGSLTATDVDKVLALERYVPSCESEAESSESITNSAIYLGKLAYEHHMHFKASNAMCVDWIASGKTFGWIAERICRVICIREEDRSFLAHDPRFLMHLFMCGLCVPTLIASKATLMAYGADEATYFNFKTHDSNGQHSPVSVDQNMTICMKYSDRSKLLALLGQCGELPRPCCDVKAFSLYKDIELCIQTNKNELVPWDATGKYEIFPLQKLLRRHGIDWKDYQTLVPKYHSYLDSEKANIDAYFNELLKKEALLE